MADTHIEEDATEVSNGRTIASSVSICQTGLTTIESGPDNGPSCVIRNALSWAMEEGSWNRPEGPRQEMMAVSTATGVHILRHTSPLALISLIETFVCSFRL